MGKPSRLVLSLDLSTHTGWALGRDYESPIYGVWELGKMENLGRCASCLANELEGATQVHQPDLVVFESPLPPQAQTHVDTARLLIGLALVTEMICFEQSVMCEEGRADEARKLVMGHGRPSKDQIVAWARGQGWRPAGDNDADALVLLRYRHILSRAKVMAGAGSAVV